MRKNDQLWLDSQKAIKIVGFLSLDIVFPAWPNVLEGHQTEIVIKHVKPSQCRVCLDMMIILSVSLDFSSEEIYFDSCRTIYSKKSLPSADFLGEPSSGL